MKKCPSCAEEILNEAVKCRHCGESVVPAKTGLSQDVSPLKAVAILVAAAVSFWIYYGVGVTNSEGQFSMPATSPAVVTRAEFDQLKEGMTYAQAREIIGAAGSLDSESTLLDIKTVMYSWMNTNGSNMNAMFQNDKLITKAQFGLR